MDARGVINTDIPTLENFHTGIPPVANARTERDGQWTPGRRYAPDDAPGTPYVLATARLPQSFGKYADGLMMIYATERMDAAQPPGQNSHGGHFDGGWLNGAFHKGGRWARQYDRAIRIAVHEPASSVDGYATGWFVLDWKSEWEPTFTVQEVLDPGELETDPHRYSQSDLSLGRFGGSLDPALSGVGGAAPWVAVATQRLGEWVLFNLSGGFAEPKGMSAHYDFNPATGVYTPRSTLETFRRHHEGIFRVTPNLEVVSGVNFALATGDMFISEGAAPQVWVDIGRTYAFQASAEAMMNDTDLGVVAHSDDSYKTWLVNSLSMRSSLCLIGADSTAPEPGSNSAGYSDQVVPANLSGDVSDLPQTNGRVLTFGYPLHRYVQPFASGDYSPPEKWYLWPNPDKSHTIYRARWKGGEYALPVADGHSAVDLADDPDFAAGRIRFPRMNPSGYAFEGRWKKPGNVVGTVPPITGYTGRGDYRGLYNPGGGAGEYIGSGLASMEWKIFRDENQGALVLVMSSLDETYTAGHGAIAEAPLAVSPWVEVTRLASDVIVRPEAEHALGQAWNYNAETNQYDYTPGVPDPRPSQIWTAVSYDDGKTWSAPKQVEKELRPKPGAWATQWVAFGGAQTYLNMTQDGILTSACITADGSLVMGVLDTYVYALPAGTAEHPPVPWGGAADISAYTGDPIGGRVPFWTGPDDAGNRASLYVVESSSAFGIGQSSPDGVIYARPRTTS